MEYIETYKGLNIYKHNNMYQIGLNGASVTNINILKKIIDIKTK
jgi:hypothetical protein